ncbi:MAG: hypothetical protein ACRDWG_05495 [Actinomycetes bacterium]
MSTVDQYDHLPVEQLAEYAEGLIADPPALAAMDAHLTGCTQCQQVLHDLREVAALLRAEPVESMPPMVAIRLEAVLAAEAREHRMDQVGAEHPGSFIAASAAALESGATAAAGSGPELVGVTAAAGEPLSAERPRSLSDARRRRARTVSALAAAATVAAFAIGAAIFAQNMSGVDEAGGGAVAGREQAQDNAAHGYTGPTPATGGVYRAASGQDFTAYTLSATARDLLAQRAINEDGRAAAPTSEGEAAGPPVPALSGQASANEAGRLSTLLSPAGLAACVAQLVPDPADVQVLAVDIGTYGGIPAALLVLSDPTDPTKAQVRVVGAPCGQGKAAEFLRTEILRGLTPAPTRS